MSEGSAEHRTDQVSLAAANELDDGLTEDLRARVKGELEPGERSLWAACSDSPVDPPAAEFCAGIAILLVCLLIKSEQAP